MLRTACPTRISSPVHPFASNPRVDDFPQGSRAGALSLAFAVNYTNLLVSLHAVFNGAPQTFGQVSIKHPALHISH